MTDPNDALGRDFAVALTNLVRLCTYLVQGDFGDDAKELFRQIIAPHPSQPSLEVYLRAACSIVVSQNNTISALIHRDPLDLWERIAAISLDVINKDPQ